MPQAFPQQRDVTNAWAALEGGGAQLVDVRTEVEWQNVGVPLTPTGTRTAFITWSWPDGSLNSGFLDQLAASGLDPAVPTYFLCRSGVRSNAAAAAAHAAGFCEVFNLAHGFEGPPDPVGRRGRLAGWQAAGLPWRIPSRGS